MTNAQVSAAVTDESAFDLVRTYLAKMPRHPIEEWMADSFAAEQDVYQRQLQEELPGLNERVTNALACQWSYDWK